MCLNQVSDSFSMINCRGANPECDKLPHPLAEEWARIQRILRDNGSNVSAAVRQLGMYCRTLRRKLAKSNW